MIMEAEELIKYLKKCVDDLNLGYETLITPTTSDPRKQQFDVSFIVMEKAKLGRRPRFKINVKDILKG